MIFVTPGDANELAQALKRLLQSPEQRRRLGEQARLLFRRHFDIETTARAFHMIYERVRYDNERLRVADMYCVHHVGGKLGASCTERSW